MNNKDVIDNDQFSKHRYRITRSHSLRLRKRHQFTCSLVLSIIVRMTAAVAGPSCMLTAQHAIDAIHYRYQISAAARSALRPTALNHSLVHSMLVYHAPAPAHLSLSTVSFASCWAAKIYCAHAIAGPSVLAPSPLT